MTEETDEVTKVTKTRVLKYPDEIPDSDIELCMKEWKLVGCDVLQEGRSLLIFDPDRGGLDSAGATCYQKVKDSWHHIEITTLKKLEFSLLQKQQLARNAKLAESRSLTRKMYDNYAEELAKASNDVKRYPPRKKK